MRKLTDYCLSPAHPRGKHKARVFETALGITVEEAEDLQTMIEKGILTSPCVATQRDTYGQRYSVDISVERSGTKAVVRTSWIVKTSEEIPRLTSCYVLRIIE